MPTVSEAQRRAMEAAAHGHSTLGIPKSVGKEFVAADANAKIAAGTVFVAPDGDVLLLKRAGEQGKDNFVGHWALPGGGGEDGETPEETADREATEELGGAAPIGKKRLMDRKVTPTGMVFHTFAQPVEDKFTPRLNDEHSEFGWFPLDKLPKPIHPAVNAVLGANLGMAKDMEPDDWQELRDNFAQWTREEEAEPEHQSGGAEDDQPALSTAANAGVPAALAKWNKKAKDEAKRAKDANACPTCGGTGELAGPGSACEDCAGTGLTKRIAQDAVCRACKGRGCDKCGGSGVAPGERLAPKGSLGKAFDMALFMRGLGGLASDEFREDDHPRAPDGKFGSGSGGSSKPALKIGELKQTGGKLGSNEGGTYEGAKGEKFYVKKAPTKAHAENEKAAARLYQLAGAQTLNYRDVEGGQHVATEWQKLEKKNISEFTAAERKEAAQDFAIHAWLSNWDAAGLGGDNQGVLNGKTTTLDVGGSLRFRAQGGPKGDKFGDKVIEFDSLRDKGMNPDAAKLFAPMTEKEISASVERVSKIPDAKIREAVGADKELADRLIARKKNLASRVGVKAMDSMLRAIAQDSRKAPEHTLLVRYDGDFDFSGLLGHLKRLGSIGASRSVNAIDENDKPISFGDFDGDGHDKIWDAELDGHKMAFDRAMIADMNRYGMAFDREPSLRRVDKDGHMLVESSIISAAAVNDYLGEEIPGWKGLGLNPKQLYALYRTEEDMEKGAQTLHGKPLLIIHRGITAANHARAITVGSVINPIWESPNLRAELSVWDGEAIKLIESGRKKHLSAGYRYVPVMQAGEYKGKHFVGKMTAIEFNHVALVTDPRVEGAVVGDRALDAWHLIESAILSLGIAA